MGQIEDLRLVVDAARGFCIAANKHAGGSLSGVELVTALFFGGVADLDPARPQRDHLVYSKGHAAAPMYFCMWLARFMGACSLQELLAFGEADSPIPRMPTRDPAWGVEMSTGSLGQGLSFANGLAMADRRQGRASRTFVVLGDGELSEGQIWEAAATAALRELRNVHALVDANGYGSVIEIPREQWLAKWQAFGWDAVEVDGHDLAAVLACLRRPDAGRPRVTVCRTVKGRGLPVGLEGSNTLSSSIDAGLLPRVDLDALVARARQAVARLWRPGGQAQVRQSESAGPGARLDRDRVLSLIGPGLPVGAVWAPKLVGGQLANLARSGSITLLSPDAIRNSGLSALFREHGDWTWTNPSSPILQCAIAEQDTASTAAGMAAAGIPALVFLMEGFVWRMLDQLRESVCFSGLPVVIVGTSGGLADELGPMVQSDACLAALTQMVGLDVLEASDHNEALWLLAVALARTRPTYLRLPHGTLPVCSSLDELAARDTDTGAWVEQDCPDPELVILSAGSAMHSARGAARVLRERHRVRLVNVFSPTRLRHASPEVRTALLPPSARKVSVHNAPSSVLAPFLDDPCLAVGVDGFGAWGRPVEALYARHGLDVPAVIGLAARALEVMVA